MPLLEEGSRRPGITFFECPICHRRYARRSGRQLTFQWLHPISLALYGVQFDESPCLRAAEIADSLAERKPTKQLELFAREIRLELEDPTQPVGDVFDCAAPEEELRAFLALVLKRIDATVANRR